jgi:hypothetical protein
MKKAWLTEQRNQIAGVKLKLLVENNPTLVPAARNVKFFQWRIGMDTNTKIEDMFKAVLEAEIRFPKNHEGRRLGLYLIKNQGAPAFDR